MVVFEMALVALAVCGDMLAGVTQAALEKLHTTMAPHQAMPAGLEGVQYARLQL